jgi:hypothetical protein
MLIPRFSIKYLLIATAIAAVIALIMREAAVRAEPWAIGLVATLAGVVVVFFIFILLWSAAWVWDQTFGALLRIVWQALFPPAASSGNPFASAGPPRQIVPPSEPPL